MILLGCSVPLSRTTEKLYFLLSPQLYSAIVHIGISHTERKGMGNMKEIIFSDQEEPEGSAHPGTDLSLVLSLQVVSDLSMLELRGRSG